MSEVTKGPSKKELNKLARKEKKQQGGDVGAPAAATDQPVLYTVHISRGQGPKAELTRAAELFLGINCPKIRYVMASSAVLALPMLTQVNDESSNTGAISGDINIAKFLTRSCTTGSELYDTQDAWVVSQIDQWLDMYSYTMMSAASLSSLPELLEYYLVTKTYLAGHSVTLADVAIFLTIKRLEKSVALGIHTQRWLDLITTHMPILTPPVMTFLSTSAEKAKKEKVEKVSSVVEDEGGCCPPLVDAIEGQVCTRFPPEPSGYLHIGHAKAVLLNQYYAERYKGRLLIRFDDTNPSKEKEEFEQSILADLATLGVHGDKVREGVG
jgi:hypothetical protein